MAKENSGVPSSSSATPSAPKSSKPKRSARDYASMGYSIFSILIILLMLFTVFRMLLGGTGYVSFSQLLNLFAEAPSIDLSKLSSFTNLHIDGDWLVFDFLRNFLNFFVDILSVIAYIGAGLVNLAIYLGYFVKFLLTGIVGG